MPHYSEYKCGGPCGREIMKELLVAKKVVFTKLGPGGKMIKSRTLVWLCPDCLEQDEHWNLEAYNAPGSKSPALERVRALDAQAGKS